MAILITGGLGVIGRRLTSQLRELVVHGCGVATPGRTTLIEPTVGGELRRALESLGVEDGSAVASRCDV